jgi:Ni,Fe-hydrogenase III large subunit
MDHIILKNASTTRISEIPVLGYPVFFNHVMKLMEDPACHCLNYYGYRENSTLLRMICCIANDTTAEIYVFGFLYDLSEKPVLNSITAALPGMHPFEREISENFGIKFSGNPWDKPIRYPFDRSDKEKILDNYPFYKIESHELHEVGVGPIHAGIIEPGHFRFLCNGEKVLHLEIHLGYQHRGVEDLFLKKKSLLERSLLAESIAGDSVAANTTAFSMLCESLSDEQVSKTISNVRTLAIELERAAIHTGDLSALCTDIAYQMGSAVFQGLRTTLINTFLGWSGNRFARRLIRPGFNPFPVTGGIKNQILKNLREFTPRFNEMADYMFNMPGVLARFEGTGIVTNEQTRIIQAVGMAARTGGLVRDIRTSHPYGAFNEMKHTPQCLDSGDVQARAFLRKLEVSQSLQYVRSMLENCGEEKVVRKELKFQPSSFSIAITEGWRGEHCHCAVTDEKGDLKHYKIKDPSLHNWMALALAVRKNDISDFPVCNKSFNLSYCGCDL